MNQAVLWFTLLCAAFGALPQSEGSLTEDVAQGTDFEPSLYDIDDTSYLGQKEDVPERRNVPCVGPICALRQKALADSQKMKRYRRLDACSGPEKVRCFESYLRLWVRILNTQAGKRTFAPGKRSAPNALCPAGSDRVQCFGQYLAYYMRMLKARELARAKSIHRVVPRMSDAFL